MIATIKDVPCAFAQVTRGRGGRATLTAMLASSETIPEGDEVTCTLSGVVVFTGRVWRSGLDSGLVRLLGREAAALEKTLPPKYYKSSPLALVARDILSECGLQGDVDLPGQVGFYARHAGPGYRCLTDLLEHTGNLWRSQPNGRVYVGPETWGTGGELEQITAFDPVERVITAILSPSVLPGSRISAALNGVDGTFEVQRIQHTVSDQEVSTRLWI